MEKGKGSEDRKFIAAHENNYNGTVRDYGDNNCDGGDNKNNGNKQSGLIKSSAFLYSEIMILCYK